MGDGRMKTNEEKMDEELTKLYNNYTKERELFPIPQNDIDLSRGALVQNPGY